MFKITATNNGKATEMIFPCSEIELKARLIFVGAIEGYPAQVTVAKVHSRPEVEILEGQICDPDELNYLAKRLESFTSLEYAQFCEGIKRGGFTMPKDLINLTYNLDKYVLIQHIPSYEAIGRSYDFLEQCERKDNAQAREDERHLEQSELTEASLNRRAVEKPKTVEEIVEERELARKVYRIISSLPKIQYRRFVIYYQTDTSFEEIARKENCSSSTIRDCVNCAKRRFKIFFQKMTVENAEFCGNK